MVSATEFDRAASTHDFVAAYPEGLDLTWNAGFCCASGTSSGADDVDFLSRLIDELVVDDGIGSSRVYVIRGSLRCCRRADHGLDTGRD